MDLGERAGVTLRLPGGFQTSLCVEVRWARPEGPKNYLIGVVFDHTPETRKILRKLVWEIESGAIKGAESDPNATSSRRSPRR